MEMRGVWNSIDEINSWNVYSLNPSNTIADGQGILTTFDWTASGIVNDALQQSQVHFPMGINIFGSMSRI